MMLEYRNPEGYADLVPYHALADRSKRFIPIVYICSSDSGDVTGNIEKAKRYSRYVAN